jgi:diaminopimelate epimerase
VLQFSKYQGLGNDFLLLDGRDLEDGDRSFGLDAEAVRRLCDRRFGVGGDGVILALPPRQGGELRMRIFNADGSEPEMCGNGIRCLARFLADSDGDEPGRIWQVETLAGRIVPELRADGTIRVDMGPPFLEPAAVPTTLPLGPAGLPQGELEVEGHTFTVAAAGMGNPHVVIPVEDVEAVELERFGAALERHPAFPARTNVHFVQVLSPEHLVMRVWERGAGPTLACGTGACATLVACHRLGLCQCRARLDLPGGPLWIEWAGDGASVFMSGPAEAVFDGVVVPGLLGEPAVVGQPPAAKSVASATPLTRAPAEAATEGSSLAAALPAIDCATACGNGCLRPEACSSAEARARVAALLAGRSLDELVALATATAERRSLEGPRPDDAA